MFINATYLGRICTVCIKVTTMMVVMTVLLAQVGLAQSLDTRALSKADQAASLFKQARAYHDGIGVPVDIVKAIGLYEQSAVKGNADAKLNLGFIYFTGQGGQQNYGIARQYYMQAAQAGDKSAQENLGLIYEHGLGVKANQKTAKMWYDMSKGIVKLPPPVKISKPAVKAVVLPKLVPKPEIKMQMVDIEGLKEIKIPDSLLTKMIVEVPQTLRAAHTPPANGEVGLDAFASTITGKTAHAAPAQSLTPLGGFKPQFDIIQLPKWVGSLMSLSLFLLATLSAIWFVTQLRRIHYQNARYKFTSVFFEKHRESLRGSYLRTPDSHRSHDLLHQPWAVSLCALMVRFAANRQADPNINCQISKRVVRRLKEAPYSARKEVFGFIPLVQDRLYFDIESLSSGKLSPLKPYQFDHSKFFINKARKNKLK